MSRSYDIAERLKNGNKKPTVKIDNEHIYEISTSKNTAIYLKALSEDDKMDEFESIDKIIEAGLGKDALEYINSLDYSMASYTTIVNVIMAAINDVSLEEIEAMDAEANTNNSNFRKKKKKRRK